MAVAFEAAFFVVPQPFLPQAIKHLHSFICYKSIIKKAQKSIFDQQAEWCGYLYSEIEEDTGAGNVPPLRLNLDKTLKIGTRTFNLAERWPRRAAI